jgi:putative endopeptidase
MAGEGAPDMETGPWGFTTESIDEAVRPGDDFFRYAGGKWLTHTEIPKDETVWGSFNIIAFENDERLRAMLAKLEKIEAAEGSDEKLVRDMYASASDMETRNRLGAAPLSPWLEKIRALNSSEELPEYFAESTRRVGATPFFFYIAPDEKDSNRNAVHLFQGGLGMPDRDYYLKDEPEFLRVREAYRAHLMALLRLAGYSETECAERVEASLRMETRMAEASMTKEDCRFPEKTYHPVTQAELQRSAPGIEWQRYFSLLGLDAQEGLIVAQPDFLTEIARMAEETDLADWKAYLECRLIRGAAPLLSDPFVEENFAFRGKVLGGQEEMKPLWRRALGATEGAVGESVGKLFVKEYFTEAAKRRMDELVEDVVQAFEKRIKNLDWMSAETKERALEKLRKISRKIGYPEKWKGYDGLLIRKNEFFENAVRASEFEFVRDLQKLSKPVDRTEWLMDPQEVNAYYSTEWNDIVSPAGILQPPFFNPDADAAVNYGAIGAIIGHELTHGFDDQGSKSDAEGNLNNWWTDEDRARFDEKGRKLAAQFNEYELEGMHVNGELTKGENIADLGGLVIGFDAYEAYLERTGDRKDLDGFTPEQRFFLGFAQAERAIVRAEAVKTRLVIDPHSPPEFRVNGPLSNFDPFYEAFGLTESNKLWREPEERLKIW